MRRARKQSTHPATPQRLVRHRHPAATLEADTANSTAHRRSPLPPTRPARVDHPADDSPPEKSTRPARRGIADGPLAPIATRPAARVDYSTVGTPPDRSTRPTWPRSPQLCVRSLLLAPRVSTVRLTTRHLRGRLAGPGRDPRRLASFATAQPARVDRPVDDSPLERLTRPARRGIADGLLYPAPTNPLRVSTVRWSTRRLEGRLARRGCASHSFAPVRCCSPRVC